MPAHMRMHALPASLSLSHTLTLLSFSSRTLFLTLTLLPFFSRSSLPILPQDFYRKYEKWIPVKVFQKMEESIRTNKAWLERNEREVCAWEEENRGRR